MSDHTWDELNSALRRFAKSKSDDDWQAVEEALQARDAFHLRVSTRRAVRYANHGLSQPPTDPCESCQMAVEKVLSELAAEPRT